MKLPMFVRNVIQTKGELYRIESTRNIFVGVAASLSILLLVGIGFGIWGIYKQVEASRLQQQVILQEEQLKLLNEKTKVLETKMKKLDSLDQELRQMISGSEGGALPQGGGTEADLAAAKEARSAAGGEESAVTPVTLMSMIYGLDKRAQSHLVSFYTLRAVLKDGGADRIKDLQTDLITKNADVTSTMPSIWPVKGVVTSGFGGRTDPVYGGYATHDGVDIANDYGTPIEATAAGVVSFAGVAGGYGELVEINHGNGFVTRYGHASVLLVSEGMKITKGQTIALMGSSGKSTGSHTHYEVDINGTPVDPMLFLPIQ